MKNVAFIMIFIIQITMSFNNIHAQGIVTTLVGDSTAGYSGDGGPATMAELNYPYGVCFDATGNLYIADLNNFAIRKVSTTGIITTIAGGTYGYRGDGGPASSAAIGYTKGICADIYGNIYFSDWVSSVIRKINTSGIIITVAGNGTMGYSGDGGSATNAQLNMPQGLCVASGCLYVADMENNCIRKVNLATGIISTIAGNGTSGYAGDGGPSDSAILYNPSSICVNSANDLFVADENNFRIRKIKAGTGIISTIVGDGIGCWTGDGGPATDASIGDVNGICLDSYGNIYIDDNTHCRKINVSTGIINTVAGSGIANGYSGDGGLADSALFNEPTGLCIDEITGDIIIADVLNARIRKVTQPYYFESTKTNNIVTEPEPVIFPNPSSGRFSIQIPDIQKKSVAEIFNIEGQKVYTCTLNDNLTNIDLAYMTAGSYVVSIHSPSGNYFSQEIIINH